jgi:putative tricarboxylic transport membrane protein
MKRYGYPVAGVVLGVILTPIIDNNFRRGVAMEHGDVLAFFGSMFTNKIALCLIAVSILTVMFSSPQLAPLRVKLFGENYR